VPAIRGNWR